MYVAASAIRPLLQVRAEAEVPTRFGTFKMIVFNYGPRGDQPSTDTGLSPDHVALVMGDLKDKEHVLCRVHSECMTSEVFGSLKCDCREQLEAAQLEIAKRIRAVHQRVTSQLEIAKRGEGVVLYLRQEGRGIGLANKIRAYELQSLGHDTVDANRLLDLPDDARSYDAAAAMLGHLGVGSVRLLTNNPLKIEAMERLGVTVDRAPSHVEPNAHSRSYLEAKRERMNHALPLFGKAG